MSLTLILIKNRRGQAHQIIASLEEGLNLLDYHHYFEMGMFIILMIDHKMAENI